MSPRCIVALHSEENLIQKFLRESVLWNSHECGKRLFYMELNTES